MSAVTREILDFWFLRSGVAGHGAMRGEWFRKDAAFDEQVRVRFGAAVDRALGHGWLEWDTTPQGALARILLLDQFPRNIFRSTARAFAGDALALSAAEALLVRGDDVRLAPIERLFAYLPFEHAESLPSQERAVALFATLNANGGFADIHDYAVRHRDVIRRFGRFPHRNAVLRRCSTAEEEAFLGQPGSSF